MNEHAYNKKLRESLTKDGFFVIKHADGFTKGVPDLSATRNKKTVWLEGKLHKCTSGWVNPFRWKLMIHEDDRVQLENMVTLGVKGIAFYALYQEWERDSMLWIIHPNTVHRSVLQDVAIELPDSVPWDKVLPWV